MLSRVADSLYWMSRYLERTEHTARMLEVNFTLSLDPSATSEEARWRRLMLAIGAPMDKWGDDSHALVHSLIHDGSIKTSVRACVAAARDNAQQVREEISSEQWMQLNRLYHLTTEQRPVNEGISHSDDFLSEVLNGLHLFQGVTDTTMSHGEGWQFIQIGRAIERASSIATLLSVYEFEIAANQNHHEQAVGSSQFLEWIGLLRCCTAFEAYCNVYTADLIESQILEFLLLNKDFPHSLRYSVDRLRDALLALEQESGRLAPPELVRVSGRLQSALQFVEISDVLQGGVGDYLNMIARECRRIHTLLYRDYIHYSVQTALAM